MSEHVPSLEELAAQHNVDIAFLRDFHEGLARRARNLPLFWMWTSPWPCKIFVPSAGSPGCLATQVQFWFVRSRPMNAAISWDAHLSEQASAIDGFSEHTHFAHWVFTWGSEQTQAIWTVTNTLHDAENQFEEWKEAFVEGMRTMHAPALDGLDTNVFGNV